MKHTPESIQKVLAEIGQRIPQSLRDSLIETVKLSPSIEMVVDKVLADENSRPELKEKLKVLKESGQFTKTKKQVNPTIAKIYDQFVNREIAKEVKKGRLPKNPRKYIYGQKNSN